MADILSERWQAVANRERALLGNLVGFLHGFGAPPEDARLARRTLFDVGDLFLLVIVGEFNAGEPAFVNALLGEEISPEGTIPTTDRITILKHSPGPVRRERREGVVEHDHPNEFLKEIVVVDKPGNNAVLRHHEELSRDFVPRSDLVLFITSAARLFSESECDYLQLIHEWGKKVVLIVNQ